MKEKNILAKTEKKKNNRQENNLGTDDIKKLVLRIAIPAMLAQFVSVLYSVVDRIYIGNIPQIGEIALAGVGICGPIVTTLSAFAAWIGIGGAPLMSIKMGEGKPEQAKHILANAFALLIGMSIVLSIAGYAFKDELLRTFGATEEIFPYANEYMSICLIGTLFAILSLGLNQFIICQGFARLGMCSVIIGAVFNIVLDPIFIFGLGMGVKGAAIATVISQMLSCLFTLYVLFGKIMPIGVSFGGYSPKICGKIMIVGFTPFFIILFDSLLIIIQNMLLKQYGGADSGILITCNTIVQSFMLLVTMPLAGITGGTQAILGFNYGARNDHRIKQAEKEIMKMGVIFCTIMLLIAQFGASWFVLMFTKEPLYINQSVEFIKIYTLGIIPMAVQYSIVDGFTGMGMAQASMPLSCFRKSLYIALMIWLCIKKGAEQLFWAEPISDMIGATVSSIVFVIVLPKILARRNR